MQDDRFDDALALFPDAPPTCFVDARNLVLAALSLDTAVGNRQASAFAQHAAALAATPAEAAQALAAQGKTQLRLDAPDGAALLRAALARDPHNPDACKRLVTHYLATGATDAVLALTDDLAAQGVTHSRLFAARTLALAHSGDVAAARASVGLDTFLYRTQLAPPLGWADIETFNAALAAQLLAHPAMTYERYGSASAKSWRVEEPMSRAAPLVAVLLDAVRGAVAAHLETLDGVDHPWLRGRPAGAGCIAGASSPHRTASRNGTFTSRAG